MDLYLWNGFSHHCCYLVDDDIASWANAYDDNNGDNDGDNCEGNLRWWWQ